MTRRPALVAQADIARAARVAASLGPGWRVEIEGPVIRLSNRRRRISRRQGAIHRPGLRANTIGGSNARHAPSALAASPTRSLAPWDSALGCAAGPPWPQNPDYRALWHARVREGLSAALLGEGPQRPRPRRDEASLGWLVARHQTSSAWSSLAKSTQRQRINILNRVLAGAGDMPYREVTRALIIDGRERRAKTPSQANNFLNTMRAVFTWAVEQEFLDGDPTEGVKIVKRPKTAASKRRSRTTSPSLRRAGPRHSQYLALTLFLGEGLEAGRYSARRAPARQGRQDRDQDGEDQPTGANSDFRQARRGDRGDAEFRPRVHHQGGRRATHEGEPWKLVP